MCKLFPHITKPRHYRKAIRQKEPPKINPSGWTILKLLKWTTSYFKTHHIDSPRATAEILLSHVLHLNRIDLYLQYDKPLLKSELAKFKKLIKRRANREPVAYILGVKEFWTLELMVTRDVLIPRPDTECLVETALSHFPKNSTQGSLRILELGTGSGAIILSLLSEHPEHTYFASDRSLRSVQLAKTNCLRNNFQSPAHFFLSDWFLSIGKNIKPFDMIISNPPYIKTGEIVKLQPEIKQFEPIIALDGHQDGLYSIRHLIHTAHSYLKNHGKLLMEIGHDQKDAVELIAKEDGNYENIEFVKDYGGVNRVVFMRKNECGP